MHKIIIFPSYVVWQLKIIRKHPKAPYIAHLVWLTLTDITEVCVGFPSSFPTLASFLDVLIPVHPLFTISRTEICATESPSQECDFCTVRNLPEGSLLPFSSREFSCAFSPWCSSFYSHFLFCQTCLSLVRTDSRKQNYERLPLEFGRKVSIPD